MILFQKHWADLGHGQNGLGHLLHRTTILHTGPPVRETVDRMGDWLGLTGRAARRTGTTNIEEDFQRLPIRDRELYLRFRNELDLCRKAMLPHLEYRR